MRVPSWLIGARTAFGAPPRPRFEDDRLQSRLADMRRSLRRRLSDRIEDLFEEACLSGDFGTAEALLLAYERAEERGVRQHGRDPRIAAATLARLREALAFRRSRLAGTR
jgi:hypothetical protein